MTPAPASPAAAAPVAPARRVLIPTELPRDLPLGGGASAREVWTFHGETMGTHWRARVVSRPTDLAPHHTEVREILENAFARVVALMSPWEPTSDLRRFADLPPGESLRLAPETSAVLQSAFAVARATDHAYHPALGTVTDLLGFGPSDPAAACPPDDQRVVTAFTHSSADLRFDPAQRTLTQPGGVQLDLCSLAKGYAVDLASDRLLAAGWTQHFIEIGGDARGRGIKPDGQPWWCGLEVPAPTTPTIAALCNLAIASSGNTHRHRQHGATRVGHLVRPPHLRDSPFTGTVTVLAPTATTADAWATALHVLGPTRGSALAREQNLAAAWFSSREEILSPAFAALLR